MSVDELFVDAALADALRVQKNQGPVELTLRESAAIKRDEIALIRQKIGASASGHVTRAADRVIAAGERRMSDEAYDAFKLSVGHVDRLVEMDDHLARLEQRFDARVLREPRTYDPDSGNSYFADLIMGAYPDGPFDGAAEAAQQRMAAYGREVAAEMRAGTLEGRRAERMAADAFRTDAPDGGRDTINRFRQQLRAVGTGGGMTASVAAGGGAAFIPPAILADHLAVYLQRSPFANCVTNEDLPEFGYQVSIPRFWTDAGVNIQSETQAVDENDPSANLLQVTLVPIAGVVTISQQLFDRSTGPQGIGFDKGVGKQLATDYAHQLDQYALAQALATAGTVTYNGSWAIATASASGNFVDKVAAARNAIRNTPGAYLEPSHAFMVPPRWELIAGTADAQGRPILLPTPTGPDSRRAVGDTGQSWGGLDVWCDPNIPNLGTTSTDQAVVADSSEVFLWKSANPILEVLPQYGAASLEVLLRYYGYAACLARYPSAVQVINGTAMSAPSL